MVDFFLLVVYARSHTMSALDRTRVQSHESELFSQEITRTSKESTDDVALPVGICDARARGRSPVP